MGKSIIFCLTRGLIFASLLFCLKAFSDISAQVEPGADMGNTPSDANLPEPPMNKRIYVDNKITVNAQLRCVSTNQRWGGHKLKQSASHVVVSVPIRNAANEAKDLILKLPTDFLQSRLAQPEVYELPSGQFSGLSSLRGKTPLPVSMVYKSAGKSQLSFNFLPNTKIKMKDTARQVKFKQLSGSLSPLTTARLGIWSDPKINAKVAYFPNPDANQKSGSMEIEAALPTGRGLKGCKSYTSPLMVFFDDKRPQFTHISSFPIVKDAKYVVWPEQESPGYFVALDQNKDGKITEAHELFGNIGLQSDYENGFEALRVFDSNKDNKMDSKDKVFSQLVLWNDKNGNGIGEADEQIPLNQDIKSIELNYKKSEIVFGKGRAKG